MHLKRATTLSALILVIAAIGAAPLRCESNSSDGVKVVQKLSLGGEGRWDYLLADSADKRLYIARATRFMVVSTETGGLVGEIPDTPGAHGVALAKELGIGFTSNGQENQVTVFDLKTLKPIKKIAAGQNPDAILYHSPTSSVFVFNGQSHDVTVIDAKSLSVVASVLLAGKPEFAVADDHGNVYVNIANKNTLTVIDAQVRKVKNVWSLAPCDEPTGLAIDRGTDTAFASCGNKKLAIVNLSTGKVSQTLPIGDDCDATAFDPNTNLIFASNGEGTLTVIGRDGGGSYRVRQTLKTQPGSKTLALDVANRRLYIPAAKFSGPPTQKPRPKVLPGTFEIWVLSE